MIDERKCSWPIEPIQVILTRIKGPIFSIADMNSAYNQMPLDKPSQRLSDNLITITKTTNLLMLRIFHPRYNNRPNVTNTHSLSHYSKE